jgi:hypothetical protein
MHGRGPGASSRPHAAVVHHHGKGWMEATDRTRRPYAPPRLAVYGRLEELTLTNDNPKNKNDVIQGMDNLKT